MSGRLRIGIAIGADEVTAVARAGNAVHAASAPFTADAGEDRAASLRTAFEAVSSRLAVALGRPVSGAEASVALLPPHSDARLVPLPPLRPVEAEAVLRRDAGRYFLGGNGPRVIAAEPPPGTGKPAFAASAPSIMVEAARAATVAAGWRPARIVPGGAAWLAAAGKARRTGVIVAIEDGAAHVIRLARGELESVRRVPADLVDEIVQAAGDVEGDVAVFSERRARESLVRALAAAGWKVVSDAVEHGSAAEAAAAHAPDARLELIPPILAVQRKERQRTLAKRMVAAAGVLIVLAAGLEYWGAKREVDELIRRRAAIREQVAPLLAARDSLGELAERTLVIRDLERSSSRLTRALFDLSMLLPLDTHLTSLEARGDTLTIEASGARAGAAIQSLRQAGTFADVRLLGTVERQVEDGTTTVETFRLEARLARPESGEASAGRASNSLLARRSR